MEITVQELAALVGGQFALAEDGAKKIRGAAAIAEAGEGQVTFFGNAKYLAQLKASRATAVLVPADFAEPIAAVAVQVENPSLAFAKLLEKFAPEAIRFAPGVHPTAIIGQGVMLGEDVSIQPYVVIEEGARVGDHTIIGAHSYLGHEATVGANCHFAPRVTVGARCVVGNRVILHSGVVVGSDGFGYELSGGKHVKIPQTGIVQLDDDVEIGANTTLDRARFGRTWIQEGTKIDNLVQIAHNVVVGKHCIIVSQVGISGSTRLGNYVVLAGQVGVVGHIEIGDQAVVGAQAGVSKSVAPKQMVWGSPASPIKEAKLQTAAVRRLPKLHQRVAAIERTLNTLQKPADAEN